METTNATRIIYGTDAEKKYTLSLRNTLHGLSTPVYTAAVEAIRTSGVLNNVPDSKGVSLGVPNATIKAQEIKTFREKII